MGLKKKALIMAAGVGCGLALREWMYRQREMGLPGRVALVTGSSRGLGFLLARELAREGCKVVICARDGQELERARQELAREGADVMAVRCDVTDREQVEWMVAKATNHYGRIDILINNAGVLQAGPLSTMTPNDFELAMDVMFWGVLAPTMAVLPQMRARREGRIVNITSIGGKVPVPHLVPYECGKYAAVGLSEGLRVELAQEGIKVVTVVPGLMRTGSFLNAYVKGQRETEFTLFGLVANLPIVSINAEKAARRIVMAAKRGDPECILSIPANIWVRLHGLFPGLMLDLTGLAARFLPGADTSKTEMERGMEVKPRVESPLLDTLMSLGLQSAEKYNQYPGPVQATLQVGHSHNGHAHKAE